MIDTDNIKEISVDGKTIELKKNPQYKNTLQRRKLIIVEGPDDLYFFNYYLNFLGITNIEIRYACTKFGHLELSTYMKSLNGFSLVESLGLACDANDHSAEQEFTRLRGEIEKINGNPPISGMRFIFPADIKSFSNSIPKIGVYIFPNNKDKGTLEDLFLLCINDKPEMKCVDSFMECIKDLGTTPKKYSKAKATAYLSSQKECQRGVGGAAREGLWPFNSAELNGVKQFLENM